MKIPESIDFDKSLIHNDTRDPALQDTLQEIRDYMTWCTRGLHARLQAFSDWPDKKTLTAITEEAHERLAEIMHHIVTTRDACRDSGNDSGDTIATDWINACMYSSNVILSQLYEAISYSNQLAKSKTKEQGGQ